MRTFTIATAALLVLAAAPHASGQSKAVRDRALIEYRLGWDDMTVEKFAEAAAEFQNAIDIDPSFEEAYYSLGRADMALKRYAEAIAAYTQCRDRYQARAGRKFTNAQEAQRSRREQITEIDDRIRYLQQLPQTLQVQDQLRQIQEFKRRMLEDISRGNNISIENSVPAYVSLALGSAFFRAGQMQDAEREYKAAIAADSSAGEAHQNLAVLYLMTKRYDEAERSLEAAKKVGFKVNPALEAEIRAKKKG